MDSERGFIKPCLMVANPLTRIVLRAVQLSADLASLTSSRLVRWTGKSAQVIHPKHLLPDLSPPWYVSLVRPGDHVLDLGAGVGVHAMRCARAGANVIAADWSEKNLAKARSLLAGAPFVVPTLVGSNKGTPTEVGTTNSSPLSQPNVERREGSYDNNVRAAVRLVRCDASKPLPFRAESFTGALLFDIIEHLPDDAAALRECARVLRSGAWLAIALPNSQTRWKGRYRRAGLFWMNDRDHKREYTWPEAVALIESAGLHLQSGPETIALDTPLTGWIDLAGGLSLRLYRRLLEWRARALARHPQDTTGFRCTAIKP